MQENGINGVVRIRCRMIPGRVQYAGVKCARGGWPLAPVESAATVPRMPGCGGFDPERRACAWRKADQPVSGDPAVDSLTGGGRWGTSSTGMAKSISSELMKFRHAEYP